MNRTNGRTRNFCFISGISLGIADRCTQLYKQMKSYFLTSNPMVHRLWGGSVLLLVFPDEDFSGAPVPSSG